MKGLEALEKLHKHSYEDMKEKIACFKTIKKELKALEIIKEHLVYDQETNVLKANFQWLIRGKEEHDLLKEILK